MDVTIWHYVIFTAAIFAMLAVDLGLFHRKAHSVKFREAVMWYFVWLTLAAIFAGWIFWQGGSDKGAEFVTGYVIELMLSVDNIFVFLVIFSYFKVPSQFQHRVLFYGILGAVFMRAAFIGLGVSLINMFEWTIYIFGIFLVYTGIKLLIRKEGEVDPDQNPMVKIVRKVIPVSGEYDGQKFFTRKNGVLMITPLLLVLLAVESADVVFAVDSVPAILAITTDPFIVWTSNVFAILGLRSLFFIFSDLVSTIRYLKYGLSVMLTFIGLKLLAHDIYHMPTYVSLGVVVGVLVITVAASYIIKPSEADAHAHGGKSDKEPAQDSH
ncbi:MAG: TerC family protein [SAR202 cluster bacterium]|nr:TerC family protein [SAR202 cluster bacterium]